MTTLAYDEKLGGECVAALKSAATACGNVQGVAACDGIFTGAVPPGGRCVADFECALGSAPIVKCSNAGCVQVARAGAGESCTCDLSTSHQNFCSSNPGTAVCDVGLSCAYPAAPEGQVCVAAAAVGADCGDRGCVEGARCDGASVTPTCVALVALFGSCRATEECVHGAFCARGICVELKKDGEPCAGSDECVTFCGAGGVCGSAGSLSAPGYCH